METSERIRAALGGLTEHYQARAALEDEFREEDLLPQVAALQLALDYHPSGPNEEERREQWGVFTPMIETTTGVYPISPSHVDEGVRAHWRELARQALPAVAAARLADLLWGLRDGDRPDVWARQAIAAYLEISGTLGPVSLRRAESLVRASEIARELNDQALLSATSTECVRAAQEALHSDEHAPGVSLRIIDSLCRLPQVKQPAELQELIAQALIRCSTDPWLFGAVADLAMAGARGDAERIRDLQDQRIDTWIDAANRSQGLVAARHLESAIDLARQYGREDIAAGLRLRLQGMAPTLELQTVAAGVEVPRGEVDEFIEGFVMTGDLTLSLRRFAAHCPLPESRDSTADYIRTLMSDHPLQFLTSRVVLGPGNLPLWHISTPEQHFDSALTTHEAMTISTWGIFAVEVIDSIHTRLAPTREDLLAFLETGTLTSRVAEPLADAIELFVEGRFDSALMTALPRIETMVRAMSQELGLVIFVEPRDSRPGRMKGLGVLLDGLKGHFDERRRHYLNTLLADPLANNLRNTALHGILLTGTREQAALVIHAALIFSLFELESGT